MFITKEQAEELREELLRQLAKVRAGDASLLRFARAIPGDLHYPIAVAIQTSTVPAIGCPSEEASGSTAMYPKADGRWSIGMVGSVWLDVAVQEKLFRVAFHRDDGLFITVPLEEG
jgi:hypothetical protein